MKLFLVLAVALLASAVARSQSPRLTSDDLPPTAALPPVAPPAPAVPPVIVAAAPVAACGQAAVAACAPMASAGACGQSAADASACSGGSFGRRQPVRSVVRWLFGGRLRGCGQ